MSSTEAGEPQGGSDASPEAPPANLSIPSPAPEEAGAASKAPPVAVSPSSASSGGPPGARKGKGGRGGKQQRGADGGGSARPPMNQTELKAAIRRQIEFYFGRANLPNDSYLRSLMNAQMAVPIADIARFKRMTMICDDHTLLTSLIPAAVAGSTVCAVTSDGAGIRPNIKTERDTIILRDIPADTEMKDISEIFAGGKQPTSIRSDVGDTWFICFESEDDAVATMMAINKKQITFEGKAIKARLKNADNVRAFMGAGPNAGGAGSGGPGPDRRINSSPKGYPMQQMMPPYMGMPMNGHQPYGAYNGSSPHLYSPRQHFNAPPGTNGMGVQWTMNGSMNGGPGGPRPDRPSPRNGGNVGGPGGRGNMGMGGVDGMRGGMPRGELRQKDNRKPVKELRNPDAAEAAPTSKKNKGKKESAQNILEKGQTKQASEEHRTQTETPSTKDARSQDSPQDAEKIVAPVVKDPSFGLEKGSDASARDGEEGGPAVDPAAGAPTDAGAGEGAGVGVEAETSGGKQVTAEAVKQQAEAAASGPSNLTGSRSPLGDGAGIGTKNPVSPGTAVIKDGGEGNNGQHILSAANFPPLPGSNAPSVGSPPRAELAAAVPAVAPEAGPGYQLPFVKYTAAELRAMGAVASSVRDMRWDPKDHPLIMNPEPNQGFLRNGNAGLGDEDDGDEDIDVVAFGSFSPENAEEKGAEEGQVGEQAAEDDAYPVGEGPTGMPQGRQQEPTMSPPMAWGGKRSFADVLKTK